MVAFGTDAEYAFDDFLLWKSREVLAGAGFCDRSDVYSFGIILWEIMREDGSLPYAGLPPREVGPRYLGIVIVSMHKAGQNVRMHVVEVRFFVVALSPSRALCDWEQSCRVLLCPFHQVTDVFCNTCARSSHVKLYVIGRGAQVYRRGTSNFRQLPASSGQLDAKMLEQPPNRSSIVQNNMRNPRCDTGREEKRQRSLTPRYTSPA